MHLWVGFCALNFFSILSDFLSREKLTQKIAPKAEQLQVTCKFLQKQPFSTWQFVKIGVLVNFIIQVFQIAQLFGFSRFCLTFSGERKFKTQNPNLMVGHRHRV